MENQSSLSIREAEEFFTTGEDARCLDQPGSEQLTARGSEPAIRGSEQVCTCGGVDLPGIGLGHRIDCPAAFPSRGLRSGREDDAGARLPKADGRGGVLVLTPEEILALEEAQAREEARRKREELYIQLAFAARDLAESRLRTYHLGDGGCLECPTWADPAVELTHKADCKAGRVLSILDRMMDEIADGERDVEGGAR